MLAPTTEIKSTVAEGHMNNQSAIMIFQNPEINGKYYYPDYCNTNVIRLTAICIKQKEDVREHPLLYSQNNLRKTHIILGTHVVLKTCDGILFMSNACICAKQMLLMAMYEEQTNMLCHENTLLHAEYST
jgi:hypothetical protein